MSLTEVQRVDLAADICANTDPDVVANVDCSQIDGGSSVNGEIEDD